MESIPSNLAASVKNPTTGGSAMKTSSSVHKYGTISGTTATNLAPTRPALFKNNELVFEAQTADSATSQRFRSINRSFRTAVDKSFDMPSSSGKSIIHF